MFEKIAFAASAILIVLMWLLFTLGPIYIVLHFVFKYW